MKTIFLKIIFILFIANTSIILSQWYPPAYSRQYIYAIKKNQTGSGLAEVHVLNKSTNYQNYSVQQPTPLEQDWDGRFQYSVTDFSDWTYPYPSVVGIKKWGTGYGHTEVHILRPPLFTTAIQQTATSLPETDNNYVFLFGKLGDPLQNGNEADLWVIKKPDGLSDAQFRLKILSGESDFQNVIVDLAIPLSPEDYEWQFSLGLSPNFSNTKLFIYRVGRINYPSFYINFQIYNFSTLSSIYYTPFIAYGHNQVQVTSPIRQPNTGQQAFLSDVMIIRKNGSGTNKTEVHILDGLNNFQTFLNQTPTILEQTYDNFEVMGATWNIFGVDSSAITAKISDETIKEKIECYPNPFNPITKITFSIPYNSNVKLTIFNSNGQVIKQLVNEYKEKGVYESIFDGSNLSSGFYFYRLEAGDFIETKKLVLLK